MAVVRKTKSVKALLDAFNESSNALSVVELVDRFSRQMNKTTVYRVLDRLEEGGTLHSFMDKDGLKWYAKCNDCTHDHHSDQHAHFQCNSCGKVECLPSEIKVPTLPDHRVDSADLLLVGQCASCQ